MKHRPMQTFRNSLSAERIERGMKDLPPAPPCLVVPPVPISDDLPVIQASHFGKDWLRVTRMAFHKNRPADFWWELIFETRDESEAQRIAHAQRFKCFVEQQTTKAFTTWAPPKAYPVLRHFLSNGHGLCQRWHTEHEDDVELGDFDNVMGDPAWRPEMCESCVSIALAKRGEA